VISECWQNLQLGATINMVLHPVSSFAYSAALICSAAAVSIAFLRTVVVSHAQPLQLQMSQSNKLTMHSVKSIRNFQCDYSYNYE